ncbi:hypothetical protein N2152v2_002148 [Parachlorella kessleri]
MAPRHGIDGAPSEASFLSKGTSPAKPPKTAGRSPRKVDEAAFLALEEEYRRIKHRELASEDKVRQLTAQLARTEEAAKRILVRSDASAKGGAAQRLLDAEREADRLRADKAELESEVERLRKHAGDYKRQAAEAKRRMEGALQDQRHLAQKARSEHVTSRVEPRGSSNTPVSLVGKLETARGLGLMYTGPQAPSIDGNSASASPNSAKRFAQQQEELARAREEIQLLKQAEQQAEAQTQQRFHNLVRGLESEVLALARKLQAYEQQLAALGVPVSGPYGGSVNSSLGQPMGLAGLGELECLPQAILWILEEWSRNGVVYLRDPLNNGVYSSRPVSAAQTSPAGTAGAARQPSCWPHPVGLFCGGTLMAVPPRQALRLFLSLGQQLAGQAARAQALHQPLMQAAGALEAAAAVLEGAVQHSVAHSDVAALLACLGTNTAAVLQPGAFAASLQDICCLAGAVAEGSCRQLRVVQQKVAQVLHQRPEEAVRFLLSRGAGGTTPGTVQYYGLVEWLRMAVPGLSGEEVWAALLWLRTWDLHACAGGLPPADILHAFQFGAVWRIQADIGGDGGDGVVRQSLRAAKELQQQLGAGAEAARLEQALREREGELERKAIEVRVLQSRLVASEAALRSAPHALEHPHARHQAQQQQQQGAAARPARQRLSSSGVEGQDGLDEGGLRLKYLKAKSALESATACNMRLIRELEGAKSQLAALHESRTAGHSCTSSPGKENGGRPWGPAPAPCLPRSPSAPSGGAEGASLPHPAEKLRGVGGPQLLGSLQLQQQLSEARHCAAQLQIELDAAQAKLAIYRSHSGDSRAPSAAAAAAAAECAIKAVRPGQPAASHNLCQAERLGPKAGSMSSQRGQEPAAAAAADMADTLSGKQCTPSRAVHAGQPAYEPEELRGLPAHQSIVELHVHAADLGQHVLGPQGMTFLTLDFYQHETQTTAVMEGASPQYNTSTQFVVTMDDYLVAFLREGSLRVQLHACKASAAGGVGYETVGEGEVPLAQLLEEAPGATLGHRECQLLDQQGRPCGTVQYALCALRPIRTHTSASDPGKDEAGRVQPGQAAAAQQQHHHHHQQQQQRPAGTELPRAHVSAAAMNGSTRPSQANSSTEELLQRFHRVGITTGAAGGWNGQPPTGGGYMSSAIITPFEETTYIRYSRTGSPTADPSGVAAPARAMSAQVAAAAAPPMAGFHNRHSFSAADLQQSGADAIHERHDSQRAVAPADWFQGTGLPASTDVLSKRRLSVTVVGCRDLRVANPSLARPYATLSLHKCAASTRGSGEGVPNGNTKSCSSKARLQRLHGEGWLLETQPGRGPCPSFLETATATVDWPAAGGSSHHLVTPGLAAGSGSASAASGPCIEVVVFDAGVDAQRDAGGGVVGAARVRLPPDEFDMGGSGREPGRCYPLVHPVTGRHAGVIELQLAWE